MFGQFLAFQLALLALLFALPLWRMDSMGIYFGDCPRLGEKKPKEKYRKKKSDAT